MTDMMEIYSRERSRLETELVLAKDVKAVTDCVCASLERMRLQYCSSIQDRRRWAEADRLFEVSRQSVKCMLSVTGAGINVIKDEQNIKTPADRMIALMPVAAIVIGAVLTVWLVVKDMNVPAALAVAMTAIAWLETQVVYRRRMAIAAFSKVDQHELLRMLDRLMESMDYALEMSAQEEKPALQSHEQPALTGDVLSPVQMLLEAANTRDGEYALKAVPALTAALMGQGIEVVKYSEENEEYFDMYPGTEAGITIRPALVKDGKVIARGQATEEME
ncbi:MAG: hypothetical protein IJE08_01595 [Clostridia bacterium]|nr:hypothetical protein [Clostridia bacterium]